jgi:hypothetical protein
VVMLWAGGIRCIEVGIGQRGIGDEDSQDGVWGVVYCPRPTRDRLPSVNIGTTNSKLEIIFGAKTVCFTGHLQIAVRVCIVH